MEKEAVVVLSAGDPWVGRQAQRSVWGLDGVEADNSRRGRGVGASSPLGHKGYL